MPSWIVETPLPAEVVLERLQERCDVPQGWGDPTGSSRFEGEISESGFRIGPKADPFYRALVPVLSGSIQPSPSGGRFRVSRRPAVHSFNWLLRSAVSMLAVAIGVGAVWIFAFGRTDVAAFVIASGATAFGVGVGLVFVYYPIVEYRTDAENLLSLFESASGVTRDAWTRDPHLR